MSVKIIQNSIKHFVLILVIIFFSCSSGDNESTNDPEEITVTTSDFSLTIDENPEENQVLGTIQGVTNDGTVSFSILNEIPSGALSLNSITGQLSVNNQALFNFEINPTITGIIKVANGSVFETSNITINLNDLEESNITGSWTLYSQEMVDDFGSHGFTEVANNLVIEYNSMFGSPITSLLPLSSVTKIGGELFIKNCHELTSLEGLNNLETVEGDLIINYNSWLTNLNGLNNLVSVTGEGGGYGILTVSNNPSLLNMDGLLNLGFVGNHVNINLNSSLNNIDGLTNLLNIGGNLTITANGIDNGPFTNFCGITPLLENDGLVGEYQVANNGYNPTIEDILNGDCQL